MRLIDADAFPNKLKEMMIQIDKNRGEPEEDWFLYGFDEFVMALDVIDLVKEMPTIDAEPVKHGKWIYKGVRGRFPACECSVCGNVENADWAVLGDNVNYCPNCGAKMDGERREDANSN